MTRPHRGRVRHISSLRKPPICFLHFSAASLCSSLCCGRLGGLLHITGRLLAPALHLTDARTFADFLDELGVQQDSFVSELSALAQNPNSSEQFSDAARFVIKSITTVDDFTKAGIAPPGPLPRFLNVNKHKLWLAFMLMAGGFAAPPSPLPAGCLAFRACGRRASCHYAYTPASRTVQNNHVSAEYHAVQGGGGGPLVSPNPHRP